LFRLFQKNVLSKPYKHKKYLKNENFWETPNTLNSYWAGFSAADACLSGKSSFELGLSILDKKHLERFKEDVGFNGKLTTRLITDDFAKNRKMVRVRIHSADKWREDLKYNFSIVPRKTNILTGPNFENDYLSFCFLIGYTCGDGAVSFTKGKHFVIKWTSCSKGVLQWIKDLIGKYEFGGLRKQKGGFKRTITRSRNGKYFTFGLASMSALKLYDFLKDFPIPKLKRKWQNPKTLDFLSRQKLKYPDYFTNYPKLSPPGGISV
jgi:hypothetical protein